MYTYICSYTTHTHTHTHIIGICIIFLQISVYCKGGEKVLLHFVQDSPGDFVPLEDISKALGVSTNAQEGQMPSVRLKNNKIYKP